MKHFFTTKIKVTMILAVLLAVALAVTANLTGLTLPDMFVQGVLTPVRTAVSSLTDGAQQIYNYIFEYETIVKENETLKDKLAQIEDDMRQAEALAQENDRLRELLGLTQSKEDYQLVDGYIISWGSNDWTSTFTINKGSNAGLEVGMCAITANGEVAGVVTEAGSNYAVIKTVLDSSLEVSACIASSGYSGVVTGCYTSGLRDMLRMDYLSSTAIIRTQDQVVTAGSTYYPRNLILGYVVDAGYDEVGVAKYAILRPAADIANLEQVFIITEYNKE